MATKGGVSLIRIILGLVLLIFVIFVIVKFWPSDISEKTIPTKQIIANYFGDKNGQGSFSKTIGTILSFIIGDVPEKLIESSSGASGGLSALIVLICIWGMFVLATGDILNNFSSFGKGVSWGIAVLLGVAAANLKLIGIWAAAITQMFTVFGMAAIYLGLLASFIVFFVVEWGFGGGIGAWIFRRKMLQAAAKSEVKSEVGAKKVASFIRGAKEGADAFADS